MDDTPVSLHSGGHFSDRLFAIFFGFGFSLLLFISAPAWPQEPPKPSINALPLKEQITIDGFLTEPIWKRTEPVDSFVQQRPETGAAAQGKSEVWIAFDQSHIYIAANLHDPNPALIRGDERNRDASFDRSDSFAVLIDTYHDHQNGFFFETNILSALSDALISQEGGSINQDWDGLWEVAAQRTEQGWSVEFRIPFETLRFRPGESQSWGIQFRRRIPHLKEISFWNPLTPEQTFFEVSRAGHLVGIGTIGQEHRLSIKPYAKGSYQVNRTDIRDDWDVDHAIGGDLRYRFRSNLVFDLTVNTDFAETEVDRFQVNLTRFPLFFPEKREFFLEGKGFYDFGLSGRVQPFFSRRIGLVQQRPIQILGGGKLTGKVGPYGIGALMMGTGKEEELGLDSERFGVLRVTRDFGVRSNIGMIGTYRAGDEQNEGSTVGLDTTFAPTSTLVTNGFWLRSAGTTLGKPADAGFAQINWRDPFFRVLLSHLRVDEFFSPATGFVLQTDLHETYGYIDLRPQPSSGPVREFGFKAETTYQTESDGDFLYQSHYWRAQADFRSGDFILLSWDPQRERLPVDFEIRPGIVIPAGTYRYEQYNLYFNSDPERPFSGVVSLKWGGFYDGNKESLVLNFTAASVEGLKFGTGWEIDWVSLPQGNFIAQIFDADVAWSATNTILVRGLIQWNKEDRAVAANLRFSWEYRPGSRLFLIANPFHQGNENTTLFLAKLTWLWEPL
jgi:hypothetical protein